MGELMRGGGNFQVMVVFGKVIHQRVLEIIRHQWISRCSPFIPVNNDEVVLVIQRLVVAVGVAKWVIK